MTELLTIGEVAQRSEVAASARRFDEERGFITAERAGSGHRRFGRPVPRRIACTVVAQRVGLTLEEIGAQLAELPAERAPTRRDWAEVSRAWTARIDERIAELERLRSGLRSASLRGLSPDRCAGQPGRPHGDPGGRPRFWLGDA